MVDDAATRPDPGDERGPADQRGPAPTPGPAPEPHPAARRATDEQPVVNRATGQRPADPLEAEESSRSAPATTPQDGPAERVAHAVADAIPEDLKPHLRGWLHLGMAPLALAGGIVLVALAPTAHTRLASVVFALTAAVLFITSATYHRWKAGTRTKAVLKRLDHANIFLIIAGTYTPLAMVLPRRSALTLLGIIWCGALLGVAFRVFWHHAPRWLYTPLYVALGWVAMFYIVPLWRLAGAAPVVLVIVGGVLYTLGAVVYGLKRPNPSPRWFGFHEIFHAFTIAAFVTHYIAVSLVVYGATPRGTV